MWMRAIVGAAICLIGGLWFLQGSVSRGRRHCHSRAWIGGAGVRSASAHCLGDLAATDLSPEPPKNAPTARGPPDPTCLAERPEGPGWC
jgi:hypothetical protein